MMPPPYITATEFAARLGVSRELAARWCRAGRVRGAFLAGQTWMVPADAERPVALGPGGAPMHKANTEAEAEL